MYGSLSVVLIWAISMICVSLLGKFQEKVKLLTLGLKGLAIGTLLSDALLHIVPTVNNYLNFLKLFKLFFFQALGIHSHGDSHDGHSHDHSEEIERDHRDPMWKMTVTIASKIFLILFFKFLNY